VLVGIGIIGFPILFENQPRPIPVNVPIDIPRKDSTAALNLPVARAPTMITETAAEAGIVAPAPKPEPKVDTRPKAEIKPEPKPVSKPEAEPKPATKPEPKPEPKVEARSESKTEARVEPKAEPKPEPKPEPKAAAKPAAPATDAARAQALLDGKAGSASAPAAATRFIVQIGAFADAGQARETRLKVERLGLTTYTHVAETPQGSRTRVRVGPMPTRQEAEKVAARLKAAGLPSAILTL
jgi:DedD protein